MFFYLRTKAMLGTLVLALHFTLGMKKFSILLIILSGFPVFSQSKRAAKRAASNDPALFGSVEFRPGIYTLDGAFNTENSAELGIAVTPTTRLSYAQDVESGASTLGTGQDVIMGDGAFKFRFKDIWTDEETKLRFSDQVRIYLPTREANRDAGMVASIRNYFTWEADITPEFSFQISEVPILHLYNEPGTTSASGAAAANPAFENRVLVGPNAKLTKDLSLSVLLALYSVKYKDYKPTAKNNDEWVPTFFLWPELSYAAAPNINLGLSYRTDNFLNTTEQGTTVIDGVGNGVFQGVIGFSF